jgi:cell division protein FtsI/penicillin-binding protein 2
MDVVSIDPDNGRILAMVNQKLALSAGAQPCSTIKVAVALAALSENVITKDTEIQLGKYYRMDLTTALAHSNNAYFATVGQKLGFERVSHYARQYGWEKLAGWQIQGEQLGTFPSAVQTHGWWSREDVLVRREYFADPSSVWRFDGFDR